MTGETDSGITFGATIRADNAMGGQGGTTGQTDGSVFVSGSWGTLTMGDTNGADEQWVGDVPGDFSLTGMGNYDETPFVSNGGGYGNSDSIQFANNQFARPTIRYDFDIAGFGISVSSNRDLTDVVVGAGYSADFGGGSWSIGAGYNDFASFDTTSTGGAQTITVIDTATGNPTTIVVPGATVANTVASGEQWSVGLKGTYSQFAFGATWSKIDLNNDNGATVSGGDAQSLLFGASYGFDAFSVGAFYQEVLNASGPFNGADGNKAYGLTGQYDLGGGATVNAGIANIDGFSRSPGRRQRGGRRLRYLDGVLIPNKGTVRRKRRAQARLFLCRQPTL